MQRITISFEYPVIFTKSVFDKENKVFADTLTRLEPGRTQRFFVVVDQGVAGTWPDLEEQIDRYTDHYGDRIELAADPLVVIGGEEAKSTMEDLNLLRKKLYEARIDRQSHVVIIGGGAVLDMAGYAAATVHRGLRTVRLPSTVLSQNDSGVGVKNGVNAFNTKNFLGTFWPPFAVINDLRFIDTLPDREKRAGIPESVKVALIRDAEFFNWLESHITELAAFEPEAMDRMIRRGAQLHMAHIANGGDPFELGTARPLDFGHWSAHKLESLTEYNMRHGEAVAIGMLLDCKYSHLIGRLEESACNRLYDFFEKLGLPLWHPALKKTSEDGQLEILAGLDEFREHLGGELTVTLIEKIGQGIEVNSMNRDLIADALDWLAVRAGQ